jgi:hypothetical protein
LGSMLRLLLDPMNVTIALVLLAVATPLAAWQLRTRLAGRRFALLLGASGPLLLILWGIHNLVLETIGFASVWSALILLVLAVCVGIAAGWWISGEANPTSKGRPEN